METETVRALVIVGVMIAGCGVVVASGLMLVRGAEIVVDRLRTSRRASSRAVSATTPAPLAHKDQNTFPHDQVRA